MSTSFISWGDYLCRGVAHFTPTYLANCENVNFTQLSGKPTTFSEHVQTHGWALLQIDSLEAAQCLCNHLGPDTLNLVPFFADLLTNWETILQQAFHSVRINGDADAQNRYRNEHALPIGHRIDDQRHFFETRVLTKTTLTSKAISCPRYPHVKNYDLIVLVLFWLLGRFASNALQALLLNIGVYPLSMLGLCDVADVEYNARILDAIRNLLFKEQCAECPTSEEADTMTNDVSSSVLRVCCYPTSSVSSSIAFGAHTDTTFLTLGPMSSVPGLEMFDFASASWIAVEELNALRRMAMSRSAKSTGALVIGLFVGELLQVLTRKHFRATIHRVRAPVGAHRERISCPLLIRGKWGRIISLKGTEPTASVPEHPGGAAALALLADLDGIDMKTLHRMLDFKREKCRKLHEQRVIAAKKLAQQQILAAKERDFQFTEAAELGDDGMWDPHWVLASDF